MIHYIRMFLFQLKERKLYFDGKSVYCHFILFLLKIVKLCAIHISCDELSIVIKPLHAMLMNFLRKFLSFWQQLKTIFYLNMRTNGFVFSCSYPSLRFSFTTSKVLTLTKQKIHFDTILKSERVEKYKKLLTKP